MSKFNAEFSNRLDSSAASDWMQRESIDKKKRLYALNVGMCVRDKYLCSRPVECEKLATASFHWFQASRPQQRVIRQTRTRQTKCWRVYLKHKIIQKVIAYFVFPEFILLETFPDSRHINNLPASVRLFEWSECGHRIVHHIECYLYAFMIRASCTACQKGTVGPLII